MKPDHERWAEALAVHRQHGDYANVFIASRIGELALAGDEAEMEHWVAIALRIDKLLEGTMQ